jgi:cytochrome c oxidase subunit III
VTDVAAVTVPRPSMLRVGTVVWLASELMFFAGLFAGYFALRSANEVWPPDDVHLDTVRIAVFTVVLVVSSFTYHHAVRSAEEGDEAGAVRWTVITFILGAAFLGNQALEYAELDFRPGSHAYGSIFYLMTGFHGLHVLGGLALMVAVLGVGVGRTSRAPLGELVGVSGYYWHFVDAVWIAMFATIYLLR